MAPVNTDPQIVLQQSPPNTPTVEGLDATTNPLLAPVPIVRRMAHFPEEVYDLRPESHLVRFVSVLLGDSGAGQLRKRLLIARLQQTLQGTHFFDLDRFYGALFGFRRNAAEDLLLNPYSDVATSDDWEATHSKDASYRSRIFQFGRAINYGATPTGMELVSEAVLSVDCDVIESYIQADEGLRTYAELEALYPTYADMEGLTYNELMGIGSAVVAGAERREFTVQPHRQITLDESYSLTRVLDRLRPADSRFTINWQGASVHEPVHFSGIASDSEFWEVITNVGRAPIGVTNPYSSSSLDPTEQPRPPFASRQGEAWTYLGDLVGMVAYSDNNGTLAMSPIQRVMLKDGSFIDYDSRNAVQTMRNILAGRSVSDSILVAAPYQGPRRTISDMLIVGTNARSTTSTVYIDNVPMDLLIQTLEQVPQLTPSHTDNKSRFWVSPERPMADTTSEILEFRLSGPRRVNYITFTTCHYPHRAVFECFNDDTGEWEEVFRRQVFDSLPGTLQRFLAPGQISIQHPNLGDHWIPCSAKIPVRDAQRFRVVLTRVRGIPPSPPYHYDADYQGIIPTIGPPGSRTGTPYPPYSLALQGIDVGYRVDSKADLPAVEDLIGTSTDVLGSLIHHIKRVDPADGLLASPPKAWKSDAQPVHYAVVNLFVDTRDPIGGAQVIDRFYVDPMYTGVHATLYFSNDEGDPSSFDDPEEFYGDLFWTPIPRDYVLQKGYLYLPPTKAKWWKFEFTNLVPEPFETLVPVTRKVKVFPGALVKEWLIGLFTGQGVEAMPEGIKTHINANFEPKFIDANYIIEQKAIGQTVQYRPTEALVSQDLVSALSVGQDSFWFRFLNWQQGHYAPRFNRAGQHRYQVAEISHFYKVAFFVGLNELTPYRLDFEADNDPELYEDHFDDTRNISPIGFTWQLNPNQLWNGDEVDAQATSKAMVSSSDVRAVQFATSQSQPLQLVPDDDFRDPALNDYHWDNLDNWHAYGDALLQYHASDNTVSIKRYATAPPRVITRIPGMVQGMIEPVFDERPFSVPDEEAVASTEGGIESGLIALSHAGRVWAAARVTADTKLSSDLFIQIVNRDGIVLAEKGLGINQGQMGEWYVGYDIGNFYHPPPPIAAYSPRSIIEPPIHTVADGDPATEIPIPPTPPEIVDDSLVRIRLIQKGKSDDTWSLDTFSLFDEGIVWEFSNNGGATWVPARGIRNNDEGVLVFSEPGNALMWRTRGTRPGVSISAIKIRPWYVGPKNARANSTHRGPNVSTFDHFPPIQQDPMFTGWTKPIPRWWFYISRRFPILPVPGLPIVTDFARFYARLAEDTAGATDEATRRYTAVRHAEERLDFPVHPDDTPDRSGSTFHRSAEDEAGAEDEPTVFVLRVPPYGGIMNRPIHPAG